MTGWEHVRFADEELIKTQVLQSTAARTVIQGENCSVYKMENETGEGVITRYPVFPGIELLYNDIHMSLGVAHREDPRENLLEINHCRTGRFECEFSDGRAVYLGEGDLAVNVMTNRTRETWFPLSHYHGITIAVDIPVADRRSSLIHLLQQPQVMDGIIQGSLKMSYDLLPLKLTSSSIRAFMA